MGWIRCVRSFPRSNPRKEQLDELTNWVRLEKENNVKKNNKHTSMESFFCSVLLMPEPALSGGNICTRCSWCNLNIDSRSLSPQSQPIGGGADVEGGFCCCLCCVCALLYCCLLLVIQSVTTHTWWPFADRFDYVCRRSQPFGPALRVPWAFVSVLFAFSSIRNLLAN